MRAKQLPLTALNNDASTSAHIRNPSQDKHGPHSATHNSVEPSCVLHQPTAKLGQRTIDDDDNATTMARATS